MPAWRRYTAPIIALGIALVAAILLVAATLRRTPPEGFAPSATAAALGDGVRRITIDAADPDRWAFLDLDAGQRIEHPGPTDWDIAFRRFRVITNGGATFAGDGAAADLGEIPFESATIPVGAEWVETRARSDSSNAAIGRWYSYSWTSHLLTPLPRVYAVRTAEGRDAVVRFVSYYCPGARPGCVTIEFALFERDGLPGTHAGTGS